MTDPEPFDDIRCAIRRRYGSSSRIANIEVATLGGSNRTVIFDLVEGAASRRLVSRQETYTASNSPFIPPDDQFRAMQIAFRCGVRVPEPVFCYDEADAMGAGFVTAFVSGETLPKRIQSIAQELSCGDGLVAELGETLARLHAIEPTEFDFLGTSADSIDPVAAQLERYESYGVERPALEYGFDWLRRNRPSPSTPVPLHGDFRLGNFMIVAPHLAALLDWECAHIGSAAEEFGWIAMRSWRFVRVDLPVAGLAVREIFHSAYEAAGGRVINFEEVRYWEIFGLVRWAVLNIMQAHGHMAGTRQSLAFAACGRNVAMMEYDLLMTLQGSYR